jgi:hypothetical protein
VTPLWGPEYSAFGSAVQITGWAVGVIDRRGRALLLDGQEPGRAGGGSLVLRLKLKGHSSRQVLRFGEPLLAASGTRGVPASAAPSVFRLAVRVASGRRVGRSAVVLVGRAVDPMMLGIGYLLPGSPLAITE